MEGIYDMLNRDNRIALVSLAETLLTIAKQHKLANIKSLEYVQ